MRYKNKRFLASLTAAGLMLGWAGNTALAALAEDTTADDPPAITEEQIVEEEPAAEPVDADLPEEQPAEEEIESPEQTPGGESALPAEEVPSDSSEPDPAVSQAAPAEEPEPTSEPVEAGPAAEDEQAAAPEETPLPSPETESDSVPEPAETQDQVPDAQAKERQNSASGTYVIRPEEGYVHTYHFVNSDGQPFDTIPDQILSPGETLHEPPAPQQQGAIFEGWYTDPQKGELFTGFGSVEPELTGNEETVLYARFRTQFYAFYHASAESQSAVVATQTYADGAQVDPSDVPFAQPGPDQALVGWTDLPGGTEPQSGWTIQSADLDLYPVIKAAAWITYDSQGGSAVTPAYVLAGQKTAAPAAPERAGYAFTGWFTDPEAAQPFAFGGTLEESITLYAGWDAKTVNYKILYWQQNADDDGYSLADTENASALTGSTTAVTVPENKYSSFHPSTDRPVEQQTVAGDGSTVVHVYYDRDIETIRFYRQVTVDNRRKEWREISELTITARYGKDVSALWPSQRTDLGNSYSSIWKVSPDGDTYQSSISAMPAGGAKFYQANKSGDYTLRCEYWLEQLDGSYALDHADEFQDRSTDWKLTKEDFYEIKGFTHNTSKGGQTGDQAKRIFYDLGSKYYGWRVYYTRDSYQITFFNGGEQDSVKTFLYEAEISDAGYTPAPPAGKENDTFAGWYLNDELAGDPYDFAGKTMPAGSFALYAKWIPPVCTLSFDLNGALAEEQDDPAAYDAQTVTVGSPAVQPPDPKRDGWTFAGWIRADNGEPFHFTARLTGDLTLQAVWTSQNSHTVTYDRGDGSGATVLDPQSYAPGAGVKLSDPPDDWQTWAQERGSGFVAWVLQDESGAEIARYLPGDKMTMPDGDVTLYALWSEPRSTTLTYDWNDGSGTRVTVPIDQPNAPYAIDQENPTRAGYYFLGWGTEPETPEENLYHKGDTIRVDTIDPECNVLYAQWIKEPTPPTGVNRSAVNGLLPLLGAAVFALVRRRKTREI